jgi:hypothetical protein
LGDAPTAAGGAAATRSAATRGVSNQTLFIGS